MAGILRQVCDALWARTKTMCMPEMTKERWEEVAKGFEMYANFPNCIGAIDGKHIRLVQPKGTGSLYYNYKLYFSTVLLAVCDANYSFIYVDIHSTQKVKELFSRASLIGFRNTPGVLYTCVRSFMQQLTT